MLRRSLPLLFVCLFLAAAGAAQTLDPERTTFVIDGHTAVVALGVVNPDKNTYSMPVYVELLDTNNVERASTAVTASIRPGERTVTLRMELGDLAETEGDDLMWFRLRWSIGETRGIASLTDIFHDNFSLRISSAGWLSSGQMYRVFVEAVDPSTDEPISDVDLAAVFRGDKKDGSKFEMSASAKTVEDGSAFIDITIPKDVILDDDLEVSIKGTRKGLTITAEDDISMLQPDLRFLLMTDKGLFQPGQTMHIRGMLLSTSGGISIVPGREIELRIEDQDDTLLFRKKLVTSEFGVASAEWRIPENARLGGYTITAISDEEDEEVGQLTTKITRYDLPNFTVSSKTDKNYYLPADRSAEVTVSADYVFGKPVPKGKVRIVEEIGRRWDWSRQEYDFKEGRIIEGETDADGKFTTKFDISEQVKEFVEDDTKDAAGFSRQKASYDEIPLTAYFTDAATNRTERRRFDLRISREPIHIYISDNGLDHIPGLPSRLYIAAFYPDGTPAECGIDISISEEDLNEYERLTHIRTNKYGLAAFDLLRPNYKDEDADVDLHITAYDRKGNTVRYKDYVSYYSPDGLHISTDKTIYRPGENIELNVISNLDDTRLIAQVFDKDRRLLNTFSTNLVAGKTKITVPYAEAYRGEIFIAVYSPADQESETTGVIFPRASRMKVTASFNKPVYKPGEEGSLSFVVTSADGSPVEAALGVSVFDKAVSLRAIADGGGSVISGFGSVLGSERFGSVTMDDIERIDLSKPIPKDLDLVAERILRGSYVSTETFSSSNYRSSANRVFAKYFEEQLKPFKAAMEKQFKENNFDHATDRGSFDRIANENGIDLDNRLDPWDEKYYVKFGFTNDKDTINVYSKGPDRKAETDDDIVTLSMSFTYFDRTGKNIDKAVQRFHERTGKFIRDRETLLRELGVKELSDRYGNPYLFDFSVHDSLYVITISSSGKDGHSNTEKTRSDDFRLWDSSINYASDIQDSVRKILERSGEKPSTADAFRSLLARYGMPVTEIRDGYGSPVYLSVRSGARYVDRPRLVVTRNADEQETRTVTKFDPVTQEFVRFDLRSVGKDGKLGTFDDFTLVSNVIILRSISKEERFVERYVLSDEAGSIFITAKDPQGAVIPGVKITIKGENFSKVFTTDERGNLWVSGLEVGTYSIIAEPLSGFAATEITGLKIQKDKTYTLDVIMYPSANTVDVSVTADALGTVTDVTDSKIQTNIVAESPATAPKEETPKLAGGFVGFTPRLREYFPETLLWRPHLITDKDGKITASFKMADNITTWQMYAIASDRSGRVALTEGETSAFRPFFIDLDPPRYLTEGDVISLPVQIRNYTGSEQKADVSMAKGDWFSISGGDRKRLSIPAGTSENAVFTFTAENVVENAKQRITAVASGDSDAVEKPVTVSPNGRKIVDSKSAVFSGVRKFEIDVPQDAIKNTAKAELKIYPNLMAHIVEAQGGLLRRPVGCGEQTVSTSYPNLMMLRFPNANAKLKQKALSNLQAGYERLLGYRSDDGGFTYWGGTSKPSVALTAYALRFLIDAKEFIAVDPDVIADAEKWLLKRVQRDGWRSEYELSGYENITANRALTTYVVRTLAMLKPEPKSDAAKNLEFGLGLVRGYSEHFEDPYRLALYGLAAFDSGHTDEAAHVAEILTGLVLTEDEGEYWNMETNTVFYGWGKPARIETTALVLQLLSRVGREKYADHIAKGLVFLLKNKDRYGVWYSTQTTINVLDCFIQLMSETDTNAKTSVKITVNGKAAKEFLLEPDAIEQQTADISAFLHSGKNLIEVATAQNSSIMAQVVAEHYAEWDKTDVSPVDVTGNRAVTLRYDCGSGNAAIMETIACTASVERVGFKGYGMLIAELGVPPGADIDRNSLDEAMVKDPSISRYEILPNLIIIYLYAKAGGTTFTFTFRPRYGIDALAPASSAYDYYNPLARAEVMPIRFVVR